MSDPAKKDLSERDICTKFITPALTDAKRDLMTQLAEQQRIVARVEELMRWCDALDARLTAARTTATHLLEATLHQILIA